MSSHYHDGDNYKAGREGHQTSYIQSTKLQYAITDQWMITLISNLVVKL